MKHDEWRVDLAVNQEFPSPEGDGPAEGLSAGQVLLQIPGYRARFVVYDVPDRHRAPLSNVDSDLEAA